MDWYGRIAVVVIVMFVAAFIAVLYVAAKHDMRREECEVECFPMAYKVIDWTCYCATEPTPTRFQAKAKSP